MSGFDGDIQRNFICHAFNVDIRPRFKQQSYDIVIAVDASKSLKRTDPGGRRNQIIKTFLDFARQRTGDRIAVVQFAAWNETQKNKVFLYPDSGDAEYPLKTVPADTAERAKFLDALKNKLDDALSSFGRGTDLNLAFEKGVFEVTKARKASGSKNKL